MNPLRSPVPEYSCLTDVISEVLDVLVIDLGKYVWQISKEHADILEPAPIGVYTHGSVEPFWMFSHDRPLFKQSTWLSTRDLTPKAFPDINSFESFISSNEPIVDSRGLVICKNPKQMKSYFTPVCEFNYSALHLAAVAAWDCIRALHREPNHWTKIPQAWLDARRWVKPEFFEEYVLTEGYDPHGPNGAREVKVPAPTQIFDLETFGEIKAMVRRIYDFVGRERYSAYGLHLRNTSLVIEKGNDFRVISYYRNIFEQHEQESTEQYGV